MERVMEPWEREPEPGDAEDIAVHAVLAFVVGIPVLGAFASGLANPEELGFCLPLLVAVAIGWLRRRPGKR